MSELKLADGMEEGADMSNIRTVLGQGDASSAGFTALEEPAVRVTGPGRDMTFQQAQALSHMEFLTSQGFGQQGVPIGARLTQTQPMSYLPPWHLTDGHIRFHSSNLTFNGLGNSNIQYASGQARPHDPFATGFGGCMNPLLRYQPSTSPYAHFLSNNAGNMPPPNGFGLGRRPSGIDHNGVSGQGADSNNWRSPSNGQMPERTASPPFNFSQRPRNEGQKRNGPRPWRSNSVSDASDENSETGRHEMFEEQLVKFPRLPVETHLKIQQQYGNRVVAYFDVGLVRFQSNNIVETVKCHVIFTTKAETGQYWLMAFSKKGRNGVMKFNRLLTPHLKVTTAGQTAIEIAPSKSSQDGGQFVFSFMNELEAKKFLDTLNTFRSKIWNHDELRLASARNVASAEQSILSDAEQVIANMDAAEQAIAKIVADEEAFANMVAEEQARAKIAASEHAISSMTASAEQTTTSGTSSDTGSVGDARPTALPVFMPTAYKAPSAKKRAKLTKGRGNRSVSEIGDCIWGPSTPCKTVFHNFRMDGPTFTMEEAWKLRQAPSPKTPVVVFMMSSSSTLYVKSRTDFTLLGIGTVKIVSIAGSYHQMEFLGKHEELICHHNIYTWNKLNVSLDSASQKWICTWAAAANLLHAPTSFPSSHNFKLELDDEASALALQAAFLESTRVAALLLPNGGNSNNPTTPTPTISSI